MKDIPTEPIDMHDGNSIVLAFFEWERKMEAEIKAKGKTPMPVFRDPLVIGHFMNWLEQSEEGKEYIRQLAINYLQRLKTNK
jgi:hypothetical protein